MNSIFKNLRALVLAPLVWINASVAAPQDLPLFKLSDLEYAGGFTFPADLYNGYTAAYAQGVIGLGEGGNSVFLVGQANSHPIAEFSIPELSTTNDIARLPRASMIQPFYRLHTRPANRNGTDFITGIAYINGQLMVNGNIFYDAAHSQTVTTLVVNDASRLGDSSISGFHNLSSHAHGSGWITKVPAIWQPLVGGTYITGYPGGLAIFTRMSVGPTAFAFDPLSLDFTNMPAGTQIPQTTLLDYGMSNPMGVTGTLADFDDYVYNVDLNNDMWTVVASANYGFIVPGTRTYLVLGSNGGMESRIGYKITQTNGNVCGGPCAYDPDDYDNYYWAFDMNDLLAVKEGRMAPHAVMPYAYGRLSVPYLKSGFNKILGGDFDAGRGLLYLTLSQRSAYGWVPSVAAFRINSNGQAALLPPSPPGDVSIRAVAQ